ncbi:hypothetical protein [Saccharopolyspora shandongensis]|uniref:hypothetical protein n=1 Tax=Saccharopolyspora shandongensis TaxID=418495 RepID=UPI0033EF1237
MKKTDASVPALTEEGALESLRERGLFTGIAQALLSDAKKCGSGEVFYAQATFQASCADGVFEISTSGPVAATRWSPRS